MRAQLSPRTIAAATILLGWCLGVVAFARREMSRTTADRMSEIALRVAPGATYYALERNGQHVGFASTTVDTLAKTLQITEYQVADVPEGGSSHRVASQTVVRLSRGLVLRDFTMTTARDSVTRRVSGWIVDDSTLAFTIVAPGVARDTQRVKVAAGTILPTMLPLALALGAPLKVGAQHVVETFDPEARVHRVVHARILAESTFVVADSAVYDGSRAKWVPAHVDTVTGWRMSIVGSAAPDVWIDENGHPIRRPTPDGMLMRRTAYELAFENWRMERPRARAADSLARRALSDTNALRPMKNCASTTSPKNRSRQLCHD
jgi:hypothetical protein